MNNELLYIQYARKSSEAKEKQIASIPDQNKECEDYADRNELKIKYRLQEEKSAYKPNRREKFNEMVALIKSGKANAILTWKPDRITRNPLEGGIVVQLLQDGWLKEIRTPQGDTYNQETSHLILQLNFGMANEYSRVLSQNVKRGLKHKYTRGEYPGNKIYGYNQIGEKGTKNLVPHAFLAPLIRRMFDLSATGNYSYGHLANWLYDNGLKSGRSGKAFSKAQMERMLRQSSYYGYFKRDGELFKGKYEPLITKELFDRTQKALTDRSKPHINTWEDTSYNGLVRCPDCGCAITMTVKTKHYKETNRTAQYYYLHCTRRRGNCTQSAVTIAEFEEMVIQRVGDMMLNEDTWKLGMEILKAKHGEVTDRNSSLLVKLHKDYEESQSKLNRLTQMRIDEELTKEEFLFQKQSVLNEQASVESMISDNKDSASSWLELTETFLNIAFYARDIIAKGSILEKRNLLMDIGENPVLKDGNLQFSFKKPFDVLLIPEYSSSVRDRRDSNP